MSELILVTLPIGNNKDLTFRAHEVLEKETLVMAEDTRVFREFCKHNGICIEGKKIDSFHDHSGDKKLNKVFQWLEKGNVILVSDAGSPVVSDPAYPIVQEAIEKGIKIRTTPGVSSVTVALELSGLPPSPFHFHAFIPREKGKRQKFSQALKSSYGTHIFFEGVSRVEGTMDILSKDYPNEKFCIARELTKDFETIHRFRGNEWDLIKKDVTFKGEFVILANISQEGTVALSPEVSELALDISKNGVHPKKLSKLLSHLTGIPTKEIYQNLQKK